MKTFAETLERASAGWVKDGVIDEAQRSAILERHPVPAGGGSRFVGIIATVGALLFTVGVSLIIKANWEAIGDWTKIGGLVALLVAAYGAGWKLKMEGGQLVKTGDACLMIGQILFLCGIALVSQIFHLNSRPAAGVLAWWLGTMAVPWMTRAKGAQFVSIVAGLLWFGMEMGTADSWIGISRHEAAPFLSVYFLLGVALWLAGIALRATRWSDFGGMHEKCGLLVTGAALYGLGFVRHESDWQRKLMTADASSLFALAVGAALAAGAGVAAWRQGRAEVKALAPWLALALVPVIGVVAIGSIGDGGWLWSALAWLTLFVLSVAVVRIGLETGREGWVNLGIALIAVNIVTRYFDLFGTMLEGGVFFVVTGVLVTALGIYLEKKRRALVARLRKETAP